MSDHILALLPALDIAAFERNAEGTFRAVAPPPSWFSRLGRDGTFPFLGHILEEAAAFWSTSTEGVRQWGPCVDVTDDGKELHYLVKAVTSGLHAYLVFQVDESADKIREVLQQVRSQALEQAHGRKDS